MLHLAELQQRRRQLVAALDNEAVIILLSAPDYLRNGDVHYPYRQNSDFYYLTAFPEANALGLLLPDGRFLLFSKPYDPVEAVWVGQAIGQEKACAVYGADAAYAIDQLETRLPNYLAGGKNYFCLGSQNPSLLKRVQHIAGSGHKPAPKEELARLTHVLHEMRLRKSPSELACLRQAATISAQGHKRAMQACRPGRYEYQLEAELIYEFYQQGSRTLAYPNIVASGANACILHYTDNATLLKADDLVLIDAACEYQSYAADITRCFPVSGRFSPEQKAIYTIVLKTQCALLDLIKPGIAWECLQAHCVQMITEGLLDLGLLQGSVASLIDQKAYKKFYMHSCGHWLGLDVHDVGSYKQDKKSRLLETNMVFTVEPGIYIPSQMTHVDEKWWNIGVRIEDDVSVTAKGCEVLSRAAPKEIADIEALMSL
jgi:Xaa-Pro aminopeptidase